ncbi:hypothetical protein Tco_1311237 [Tanacetum coccineum]
MIGSLMYLTASRPDIMFAVCACARFQVTPKASHLNAVKRIFRYLKHQPKLGLWYPRDSPFELEAFSDSDYGGASLDRKSTTSGCQFLAANCCGQVLWIQNQMMDYGFNFMNTRIHIDNESTISVIKNPVAHSRTKHIEIRFHFIRDCYEKRLIEVIKIHTDSNVADLLTKGFDVTRFNFLVGQTQAAQIKDLKSQIKQLKKKAKPVISHHNAWIKSVSMKKRLARKKSLKKKLMQRVSMTEILGVEEKESEEKGVSTEDPDDEVPLSQTMELQDESAIHQHEVNTYPTFFVMIRLLQQVLITMRSKQGETEEKEKGEDNMPLKNRVKMLLMMKRYPRKVQEEWEAEESKKMYLRKKLLRLHSPMSMTLFKQGLMISRISF